MFRRPPPHSSSSRPPSPQIRRSMSSVASTTPGFRPPTTILPSSMYRAFEKTSGLGIGLALPPSVATSPKKQPHPKMTTAAAASIQVSASLPSVDQIDQQRAEFERLEFALEQQLALEKEKLDNTCVGLQAHLMDVERDKCVPLSTRQGGNQASDSSTKKLSLSITAQLTQQRSLSKQKKVKLCVAIGSLPRVVDGVIYFSASNNSPLCQLESMVHQAIGRSSVIQFLIFVRGSWKKFESWMLHEDLSTSMVEDSLVLGVIETTPPCFPLAIPPVHLLAQFQPVRQAVSLREIHEAYLASLSSDAKYAMSKKKLPLQIRAQLAQKRILVLEDLVYQLQLQLLTKNSRIHTLETHLTDLTCAASTRADRISNQGCQTVTLLESPPTASCTIHTGSDRSGDGADIYSSPEVLKKAVYHDPWILTRIRQAFHQGESMNPSSVDAATKKESDLVVTNMNENEGLESETKEMEHSGYSDEEFENETESPRDTDSMATSVPELLGLKPQLQTTIFGEPSIVPALLSSNSTSSVQTIHLNRSLSKPFTITPISSITSSPMPLSAGNPFTCPRTRSKMKVAEFKSWCLRTAMNLSPIDGPIEEEAEKEKIITPIQEEEDLTIMDHSTTEPLIPTATIGTSSSPLSSLSPISPIHPISGMISPVVIGEAEEPTEVSSSLDFDWEMVAMHQS